jgi:hypothetical protein
MRRGFALIDVIIAGMILAIGLTTLFTITSRSLRMQQAGEVQVVVASLLDSLLGTVLTEGPLDYPKLHSTNGRFDEPFAEYTYQVKLDDPGEGAPVHVEATVTHSSGLAYSCETLIAVKLGEEPDPLREPEEPLDRILRYEELEADE